MHIVLLSGGSGKRLWPLSNEIRSKQFLKIFQNENGNRESMLQRMYRQILAVDPKAAVTIATSKNQVSAIHNQLGKNIDLCIEPCRKDTFPAIALAAAYLCDIKGLTQEESVIVCPVDPYVEYDYFLALEKLCDLADERSAELSLLGIEPAYPSEKYGYIFPADKSRISRVRQFKEKPSKVKAETYISEGAVWNAGVFACKLKYLLQKAHQLLDFTDYDDLLSKYDTLKKISFDYAVAEKEKDVQVLRFTGKWMDLGTWNTLTEIMADHCIGKSILDKGCHNVHVLNELDIPVLCMGLKNTVVAASADGILVSDKGQSGYIKEYVSGMDQQIRYIDKSWGSYRVLDVEKESLTVKVILKPGTQMKYHSHQLRDEVWTIVSGTGSTVINGKKKVVSFGEVIKLQAGCKHTIIAETELEIIEVQMGREIDVDDKQVFVLDV